MRKWGPERSNCGSLHSKSLVGPAFELSSYDINTCAHDHLSPLPLLPEQGAPRCSQPAPGPRLPHKSWTAKDRSFQNPTWDPVQRSPKVPSMHISWEFSAFKAENRVKKRYAWEALSEWTGRGSRPTALLGESAGEGLWAGCGQLNYTLKPPPSLPHPFFASRFSHKALFLGHVLQTSKPKDYEGRKSGFRLIP